MVRTQTAIAVVSAVLLVLAGCTGGMGSAPTGDVGTTSPSDADVENGADGGDVGGASAISFYLSDKPSAIGDFAHLNVTITKVGFHRVDATETDTPTETTTANETTTTRNVTSTEETPTATLTAETEASDDETTTRTSEAKEDEESDDGAETQDRDQEDEMDQDQEQDRDGNGEWVTKDVNDTTVDLTELKGANATKLDVLEVAPGTYDKVFIYVGEINATLKNGEQVRVKLPSERLHVNDRFTVGDGEDIDFVFDVSVFKAGKSGKYILKPIVSETGTGEEVEIDPVDGDETDDEKNEAGDDDDGKDNDERDERKDDANETEAEELTAELRGPIEAGQAVTLAVSQAGDPVANATVKVNDERVGATDADGTIKIEVPEDAEELEIEIETGEAELEIERTIRGGSEDGGNENENGNGNGNGNGNENETDG